MKTVILFCAVLSCIFAMKVPTFGEDWDYIDCIHGFYQPFPTSACVCDAGWGGLDCGMCQSSTACGVDGPCEQTLDIILSAGNIAYTCFGDSVADYTWGAGFILEIPPFGEATLTSLVQSTGAPMLYNCTFTDCYTYTTFTSVISTCYQTSCECTSECNSIVTNMVENLSGNAALVCDLINGSCTFSFGNQPSNIYMTCNASSCVGGNPSPQPSCTGFYDCDTCTTGGCEWCLDNSACGPILGCTDVISNPQFCPLPPCTQNSVCDDCTTNGCVWCLDWDLCYDHSSLPSNCDDFISDEQYCYL